MKKIVFMLSASALFLTSCGSSETKPTSATDSVEVTPTVEVDTVAKACCTDSTVADTVAVN